MTAEEALQIVEQILPPGTLTPVQTLVFRQSWVGEEYAAIAKGSGYDYGYIREMGAELWRSLSEALREPVKKKNFRSLIQQRFSQQLSQVQQFSAGNALNLARTAVVSRSFSLPEVPEYPGGPVPLHSKFYIEHSSLEAKAYAEIGKPGGLVHIKAPWKMGKSSLLLRVIHRATTFGYYTASLDFKQADVEVFTSLPTFLRWLCTTISLQLNLEPKLDQYWDTSAGSKVSCTLYLTRYLLQQLDAPLVLVLNDLDQVLEHAGLCREFLMLLRSWYEEARHVEILQKLRLVLAYSTDLCVPLKLNQSLNNIGLPIELPEFNVLQVQLLAQRYDVSWTSPNSVQQLMSLIGGHPYLVQLALYHLWSEEVSVDQLLQEAATPVGIYGNHLQSCLAVLQANPALAAALEQVINPQKPVYPDPTLASQLESLGLVKLEGSQLHIRCELYQQYFSAQLPHSLRGEPFPLSNN